MFTLLRKISSAALQAVCTVALVVTFVGAGFAVCAFVPQTTDILAHLTQDASSSAYDAGALNDFANAARDYTVANNDRNALVERIINIAATSGSQIAGMDADAIAAAMQAAVGSEFAQRFIFDNTALDHLDDVFAVVQIARTVIVAAAIVAAAALLITAITCGRRAVRRELMLAGGLVFLAFAALGIWAAVDFDGLFAWLHSLFFASGTWTFPAQSLLIVVFPQNFWIGMGIVWLTVTLVCALVSLLLGKVIKK